MSHHKAAPTNDGLLGYADTLTLKWRLVSAQYPKRYCKSSHCGPFEAEHPKKYQNNLFNALKVLVISTPSILCGRPLPGNRPLISNQITKLR